MSGSRRVALLAGAWVAASMIQCSTDQRRPCYFDRDCGPGERCVHATYCEATNAGGNDGGSAGGAAGGNASALCDAGQTRACDGGCANRETCVGGQWSACMSACSSGRECINDTCRCTSVSCPGGCCSGDTCEPGTLATSCGAAGSACASCPMGQQCATGACSGCNAQTCSSGCCTGSSCNPPGVMRCGTGGAVCVACEARRADSCVAGACRCGTGPQCAPGQTCDAGACVCTPSSCPSGCCQGSMCSSPLFPTCGDGGMACIACSTQTSDTCQPNGQCGCGTAASCQPNQECISGTCRCTPTSCVGGCCSGDTCIAPAVLSACGAGAGACVACDPQRANVCDAGICGCGSGAQCVSGQRCLNGTCVCDATSCPSGCCQNGRCYIGTLTACGTDGGACTDCTPRRGNLCVAGVCHCGAPSPTCQAEPCAPAACDTTSASDCVLDLGTWGCSCQDLSGPYICGVRADGCRLDGQGFPVCGCGGIVNCTIGTRCAHCWDAPLASCQTRCLPNDAGCVPCNLP